MRTIFPNRRAVYVAGLVALVLLFLTVSLLHNTEQVVNPIVARDAELRRRIQDNKAVVDAPFKEDAAENDAKANGAEEVMKEYKQNPELEHEGEHFRCRPISILDQNKAAEVSNDRKSQEDKGNVAEPPKPQAKDFENAYRREFIKNMTKHAWWNYRNITWGKNELKPISKRSHNQPIFGGDDMGATIVDGADTLYIMGLHEEYEQAKEFIQHNFTITNARTLSVFETTIRFLGGFLSLYALTRDEIYIEKAKSVADALMPAFDTKSGAAKSLVDVSSKTASNYGWVMGGGSILSEFGSLHLEFLYLSELTGNPIYKEKVQKIRDVLEKAEKKDGLYMNYFDPIKGTFMGSHVSVGALGDSFYEYLIKSYVHTEHQDTQAYYMYRNTSEAIQKKMVFTSNGGLKYVAELRHDRPEHKMSHLSCFCPGMFALEADVEQDVERKRRVMKLAEDLGHTCHESYARAVTGIGPEMFYFNGEHGETEDATSKHGENGYILRPEAMEGWFYLWRLTKNEKYKTWIWHAVQSIEKYCRKENGYVGLKNVYKPDGGYDDVQQSFFIAETLKYAYLTFADDEIPLNKWVFNTEAHPFPVGFANMKRFVKTR